MESYSFADYGKPEHANLRALILATAREGRTFHQELKDELHGPAREQFKLWEKDLLTYLEALEERDSWKERFEHLRDVLSKMIDTHRNCGARSRGPTNGEPTAKESN